MERQKRILPWVEQFRPNTLNDIISQENVIESLKKYLVTKNLPHLLLNGMAGTGKTSTIFACASELYGDDISTMVLDINASEERGIEVIRTKVTQFSTTKSFNGNNKLFKLVILDEVDAMTDDAQKLLISVMDNNIDCVRFCLICNYIKKINPAILSRCTTFKFLPIEEKKCLDKIRHIATIKSLNFTEDGLKLLYDMSKGDMRKIINTLNTCFGQIDEENLSKSLGYPSSTDINNICNFFENNSFEDSVNFTVELKNKKNYSLANIITVIVKKLLDFVIESNNTKKINNIFITDIMLKLKNIEINVSICSNEIIQTVGFVACFF